MKKDYPSGVSDVEKEIEKYFDRGLEKDSLKNILRADLYLIKTYFDGVSLKEKQTVFKQYILPVVDIFPAFFLGVFSDYLLFRRKQKLGKQKKLKKLRRIFRKNLERLFENIHAVNALLHREFPYPQTVEEVKSIFDEINKLLEDPRKNNAATSFSPRFGNLKKYFETQYQVLYESFIELAETTTVRKSEHERYKSLLFGKLPGIFPEKGWERNQNINVSAKKDKRLKLIGKNFRIFDT